MTETGVKSTGICVAMYVVNVSIKTEFLCHHTICA